MQRRANTIRRSESLPLTTDNISKTLNGGRKRGRNTKRSWSLVAGSLILVTVVVFFFVKYYDHDPKRAGPVSIFSSMENDTEMESKLPLAEFDSLQYALRHSQLVAIYFAASWCPMSTPVTNLIHEHLDDVLLQPPESEDNNEERENALKIQRRGLALVYVSSDRDEDSMANYMGENWFHVPFNSLEQDLVKRHFKTCAKPDLRHLEGLERRHEIPSLIVVSGSTQDTLTFRGAEDLEEMGAQAVDNWMELSRVSDALADKYL